jgi:hypothetical protein
MPITKEHVVHGSIAAVVAAIVGAAVGGGAVYESPKTIEQVTHEIAVSKHAWPDLTDAQKADLASRLGALKGQNVIVMSADASGADLAEDLDDAFETAGIVSSLDRPALPVGYGMGVVAAAAQSLDADLLAASLRTVTGLKVERVEGKTLGGAILVVIGKHPH